MSNRFHNKWHRKNHHTYGNASNPDAAHDPIASKDQPFLGEFVLQGALCAVAPMSAFAGYFYSNFTGLCAFAGYRAIQAKAFSFPGGDSIGLQVDSQNIAISAYAPWVGLNVYSMTHAISAYGKGRGAFIGSDIKGAEIEGGSIGAEIYSDNKAISANGFLMGAEIYSNRRAISAYGSYTAAELYGAVRAISAMSPNLGIEVYSNNRAISAYGTSIGLETASPQVALSAYSPKIAIRAYAPIYTQNSDGVRALDVRGFSFFDGDVTISGNLTAAGALTYLDTKVQITSSLYVKNEGTDTACTVIQTGNVPVAHFYDDSNSAFFIDGSTTAPGFVGINTATPNQRLTVVGNISGYSDEVSFNASRASGRWSFASGTSRATNNLSNAEGSSTLASGIASHSQGIRAVASGEASHAAGFETLASGQYATSIGIVTSATTQYSFAGGVNSIVKDRYNGFAFGNTNRVTHDSAVALGGNANLASGPRAHSSGSSGSIASGYESYTEGTRTGTGNRVPFQSYNPVTKTFTFSPANSALFFGQFYGNLQVTLRGCITGGGLGSFHEGDFFDIQVQPNSEAAVTPFNTLSALGVYPLSGGEITWSIGSGKGWIQNGSGWESHAEGYESVASGFRSSHAEGVRTLARGDNGSHSEGYETVASGRFGSHAEGYETVASGYYGSHAEGEFTEAFGNSSHAEGSGTIAGGEDSHAEGQNTSASGIASHAEGNGTTASGDYSHAEGSNTRASGIASHAENALTLASGDASHAEGYQTRARGYASHAAGYKSETPYDYSYAWSGDNTLVRNVSSSLPRQYFIYAPSGVYVPLGMVGIGTGTDYPNNNYGFPLTVNGGISSKGLRLWDNSQLIFGYYPSSNDGAAIFYQPEAADRGTLTIQTIDNADSKIVLRQFDQTSTNNYNRLIVGSDGNVGIGTGTATAIDTFNTTLAVYGTLSSYNSYVGEKLYFGSSTTPDVNLYKSAASTLKTDDNLLVTGTVSAVNFISSNGITPVAVSIPFNFRGELGTLWPSNLTVPYGYRFVITGTGPVAFFETVVGSAPAGNYPQVQLIRTPTAGSGIVTGTYFGDAVSTIIAGEFTNRTFGSPTSVRASAQAGDTVRAQITVGSTITGYTTLSGKLIFNGVLIPTNI